MRDNKLEPIAVVAEEGKVKAVDGVWSMSKVVGRKQDNPHFHFEESFAPYALFSRNQVDHIDLVVSIGGKHVVPLEVKLTVVPDNTTSAMDEKDWAPELVMRPVSSAHAMMGVASSLMEPGNGEIKSDVVAALRPTYNKISTWTNAAEILHNNLEIAEALARTIQIAEKIQRPFLLQPIWRTKGQSLELCKQCFDVFVWSDVSVISIPARESLRSSSEGMTRWLRETARHVRSLYDLLSVGDYDYSGIYKGMPLGLQTDKSFALGGRKSIVYLRHRRLVEPILNRNVLSELILYGGEGELKPERRFDAAVQAHMVTGRN